ncbi:PKD-like family lipoprotein [Pedobacter frigoris]|uniref:PKD-like family lipoprotein n=1 Tax=Pedobacter frigoris TaxID=2571272 RepID=UPI00292DA1E2|nr:PKD-like family lipoprotein [Pedobacter frigoris]
MKTYIKVISYIFVICLTLSSCTKDKGNYDLKPINEIIVDPLNDGKEIEILSGDVLKLTPAVKQENVTNGTFKYRWYMYGDNYTPAIELSDKKDLDIKITAPIGGYTLMYVVTDAATGITSTQQRHMTITSKYSSGLLVLDEKAAGGDISHISLNGEIFKNLYSEANGGSHITTPASKLVGFFYKRGLDIQKPVSIFISSPGKSTVELDPETYKEIGPFSNLLATPPQGAVQLSDITGMSSGDPVYAIVNGKLQFSTGGTSTPLFQGALLGDYELAPYIITTTNGGRQNIPSQTYLITYDQKNGRFLWFAGFNVGSFNTYSTDMTNQGAFDPNNIKKQCVYGYYSNQYAYYNWMMKDAAGKMYFYQMFPISTQKAATLYQEIKSAPEMNQATIFAGSTKLPQIYYVADNRVYLYDYTADVSRLVYTFAAGEQITDVKFAVGRVPAYETEYRVQRTLDKIYIATYNGTEGKIKEFDVAPTGDLGSPVKTYGGFGKITSMFYKEKR